MVNGGDTGVLRWLLDHSLKYQGCYGGRGGYRSTDMVTGGATGGPRLLEHLLKY